MAAAASGVRDPGRLPTQPTRSQQASNHAHARACMAAPIGVPPPASSHGPRPERGSGRPGRVSRACASHARSMTRKKNEFCPVRPTAPSGGTIGLRAGRVLGRLRRVTRAWSGRCRAVARDAHRAVARAFATHARPRERLRPLSEPLGGCGSNRGGGRSEWGGHGRSRPGKCTRGWAVTARCREADGCSGLPRAWAPSPPPASPSLTCTSFWGTPRDDV
eukprot:366559-Chlamydomonas_euryale.AAC.6